MTQSKGERTYPQFYPGIISFRNDLLSLKNAHGQATWPKVLSSSSNRHHDMYPGLHLDALSPVQEKQNQAYYEHCVEAGLELCDILLRIIEITPKANAISYITDDPIALNLYSDAKSSERFTTCLKYFDSSTLLPNVVDDNMYHLAVLYTQFLNTARQDNTLGKLLALTTSYAWIWVINPLITLSFGKEVIVDPGENARRLKASTTRFLRKKEIYHLHTQALAYEQWRAEWDAALSKLNVLNTALTSSDVTDDRETLEQQLKALGDQETLLNGLRTRLEHLPTKIVTSGYLDALLKRSTQSHAPRLNNLKRTLDREWHGLVAGNTFNYKSTNASQYITVYEQSMASVRADILQRKEHIARLDAKALLEVEAAAAREKLSALKIALTDESVNTFEPTKASLPLKSNKRRFNVLKMIQRTFFKKKPPVNPVLSSNELVSSLSTVQPVEASVVQTSYEKIAAVIVSPVDVKAATVREQDLRKFSLPDGRGSDVAGKTMTEVKKIYDQLFLSLKNAKTSKAMTDIETKINAQLQKDEDYFKQSSVGDATLQVSFTTLQQQRTELEQSLRFRLALQAFKTPYFRGTIPIPVQKPQEVEAVFNAYLRERGEYYSIRDKMDLLTAIILFPVYFSLYLPLYYLVGWDCWYETQLANREKYLIKLQKATEAYQNNPSDATLKLLRAVIHQERDKKDGIVKRHADSYLSDKPKANDAERTLKAKLKTFEVALNTLEEMRPKSQPLEPAHSTHVRSRRHRAAAG